MTAVRRWFAVAMLAIVALCLGSPGLRSEDTKKSSDTKVDHKALRAELEAVTKKFTDALNKGDGAAVAACYTKNAKLFSPYSGLIKGRKAIEEHYNKGHKGGFKSLKLDLDHVDGSGKLAYEAGKYTVTGKDDKTLGTGHYVVIWKKVDKDWLMAVEIWNSSEHDKGGTEKPKP